MTKCGFVAVMGETNVGKSTLVNQIVGAKVSIVSPKVQTTRSRVRGIFVKDDTEIVLVDVPGIFKPRRRFDRAMVACAWNEGADADVCLLVIDAKKGITEQTKGMIDEFIALKTKIVIVLNKIDLISKEKLLPLISELKDLPILKELFCISAQNGEGVDELVRYLISQMPEGDFMFDENSVSDLPDKLFASEITREKIYLNLGDELPYAIAVVTESFERKEDGSIKINQTIFVARDSQKSIILGAKGSMLKKIGMASRYELSRIFEVPVHLFLFVKVKENWSEDPEQFNTWGLDFHA